MRIRSLTIIVLLFYTIMALLTFISKPLHTKLLPKVTSAVLQQKYFPAEYTGEGVGEKSAYAIPRELIDENGLFYVQKVYKNGDEISIAYKIEVIHQKSFDENLKNQNKPEEEKADNDIKEDNNVKEDDVEVKESLRTVTIGFFDGEHYQVIEGLSIMDNIIMSGYEGLEDGDEVYVEN